MQPILSIPEQQHFETPPRFDAEERKEIFTLTTGARKLIRSFHTPENKIGFSLQWGYFRAVKRFFPLHKFHSKDIALVKILLGLEITVNLPADYEARTKRHHQATILEYFGFRKYNKVSTEELQKEVHFSCSKQIKPRSQFWGIVNFLKENHIEVPTYTKLENLLAEGYSLYEKELLTLVEEHIGVNAEFGEKHTLRNFESLISYSFFDRYKVLCLCFSSISKSVTIGL